MPELPDVESFRNYAQATSLHQRIADLSVSDAYVLTHVTEKDLQRALPGTCFESTLRHGKNLFLHTDSGVWLRLHFGMTGFPKYFKNLDDCPKYERVLFNFENGYHLAYVCQRKLGEIGLEDSPEEFARKRGLGPDALKIEREEFLEHLRRKRGMLKTSLMDQGFLAGIGNIYADEILFQCRLHPATRADSLDDEMRAEMFEVTKRVLQTAVDCNADLLRLPESFLLPHRSEGQECPRCGTELVREKVGQRSAYYCPSCQSE